jgi:hypothetical protein
MADEFEKGDKVVWSSHGQDDTPGVVERKITNGDHCVLGRPAPCTHRYERGV